MAWTGKILFLHLPPLIILHIHLFLTQMCCHKTRITEDGNWTASWTGAFWVLIKTCAEILPFFAVTTPHMARTQQPILRVPTVISSGVIRPLRETNLLPLSEAEG